MTKHSKQKQRTEEKEQGHSPLIWTRHAYRTTPSVSCACKTRPPARQLGMAAGVQVLWSPNDPSEFVTYSNDLRLYNVLDAEVGIVLSHACHHILLIQERKQLNIPTGGACKHSRFVIVNSFQIFLFLITTLASC